MSAASSTGKAALTPVHCEIEGCTWEYKIQRHRIVPGRDGGKYKAGNVIALCPNHHWLADNDILGTNELLEIVRSRYENGWPPVNEHSKPEDAPEGASSDKGSGRSPAEEPARGDGVSAADAADDAPVGEPSD